MGKSGSDCLPVNGTSQQGTSTASRCDSGRNLISCLSSSDMLRAYIDTKLLTKRYTLHSICWLISIDPMANVRDPSEQPLPNALL